MNLRGRGPTEGRGRLLRGQTLLIVTAVLTLVLASGVALAEVVKGTARDDVLGARRILVTRYAATGGTTPSAAIVAMTTCSATGRRRNPWRQERRYHLRQRRPGQALRRPWLLVRIHAGDGQDLANGDSGTDSIYALPTATRSSPAAGTTS